MRILMIGLGSIGQRHLRNLKRIYGNEFEIIAYRTRRLQQTFSDNMQIREGISLEEEFGLKVFTDLKTALEQRPDVAYITNITSKHMETAIACANAGCNLFIEKPLSDSIDGIDILKEVVKQKKLKVFLGFQNRYHICIKEAKRVLEEGQIGNIQSVASEFSERLTTMHTYEDYRQTYMAKADMGGGPILNLQIHDMDLLHYLFGEPVDVYSIIAKNSPLEVDVEDGASSIYTFRNRDGNCFPIYAHTDFLQYPPVHMFKIVGDNGRLEIDMNNSSIKVIVDGELVRDDAFSDFQRNDMFIEEMIDFINCVKENKEPIIDLEQGVVSLKMALASKKSAKEKRVITMEEI